MDIKLNGSVSEQPPELSQAEIEAESAASSPEITAEKKETSPETEDVATAAEISSDTIPSAPRRHIPIPQIPTADPVAAKVEKILEEGLQETYLTLSPVAQQEFKIKGEKTAEAISALLRSAHVKAKQIFNLILAWLKILPGVNRFFLEQEAKVKTDKILSLK